MATTVCHQLPNPVSVWLPGVVTAPRPVTINDVAARDTVDGATPARAATSLMVTGRGAVTTPGNHTVTAFGN